jgi:sterol desaturase/sphingolipid hydroxylase (fatty acid hydroxylase superfamily)
MKKMITYFFFPSILIGILTSAWYAMQSGYSVELVVALSSVTAALIIIVTEYIHPLHKDWLKSHGDVTTDITHMLLSTTMVPVLFKAVTMSFFVYLANIVKNKLGFSFWPIEWPIVAQLFLALLIGEFCPYWVHRWGHTTKLWRLHATHHSAHRLYWLNAGRFHPIDNILLYIAEATPLILLGVTDQVMALFVIFTGLHGMCQHANINMKLGPLNYIFSMAELHRWHHSKKLEEANNNFGANLIFWDILFGTFFYPKNRTIQPDGVGLKDMPRFPQKYFSQLLSPFQWKEKEWKTVK